MRCPKCGESIDQAAIRSLEDCGVVPNRNGNVEFDCEYCKTELHGPFHVEMVVKVECLNCGNTGAVDSGGQNPDGSWIDVDCPECRPPKPSKEK